MKKVYGYCRVSTKNQSVERQRRNIKELYPDAILIEEKFSGAKFDGRKEWKKLYNTVLKEACKDDIEITIIFDSVSRMSRNAEEGFQIYEELYNLGVSLVFLKEPQINTDNYRSALSSNQIPMTGTDVDILLEAVKKYLMILAKKQIQLSFEQAEKELNDIHQRIKEGLETAKLNGKQIGRVTGRKYVTKKSTEIKKIILKNSKTFNDGIGMSDIKLIQFINGGNLKISRNSYYKYKRELIEEQNEQNIT